MRQLFITTAVSISVFACGGQSPDAAQSFTVEPAKAFETCIAESPFLAYGEGQQFPAASSVPPAAATGEVQSIPECNGNTEFKFAAGIADITGPAGGKIHMGNEDPANYSAGIHIRQYARTFIIESPCNGKRVAISLTDTGMLFESVRKAVLDKIALDDDLKDLYFADNVMMGPTHTHSAPGGQAHFTAYNALRGGHDPIAFEVTVNGLFESIKRAHNNFVANNDSGTIGYALGELTGANKSRAVPAYMQNIQTERDRFLDISGQDVTTPRLMTLLKMQRHSGKEVGSLNWFAVHPTSDALSEYGLGAVPISGDNKGYAAYLFERFKQTDHKDLVSNEPFVSSFMQADEGDAFTQMFFDAGAEERTEGDKHLPTNEPSPVTVANGQKQLNKALQLYRDASLNLSGPVDYRFGYVQMNEVTVTDQYVLDNMQHPTELDTTPYETCNPAMGVSFPAAGHGAQPGEQGQFTEAGVTCSDPDAQAMSTAFQNEFRALSNGNVPTNLFSALVGCNIGDIAPGYQCHAEKPILFTFGPPANVSAVVVPFQLFRIGNLATIALPWEITTMAGRRIRESLIDVLKADGIDYVVITGLANDYVSYLTTREEYALQMYEAASNQFGPWTLAAVQQEARRLARDMVNTRPTDQTLQPPVTSPDVEQTAPPTASNQPRPDSPYGTVTEAPNTSYAPGDTVRAVFQASSLNADLKTGGSFLFIEQQQEDGNWEVFAVDSDPETSMVWHSSSPEPQFNATIEATVEILWRIPKNQAPGTFRIRFEGTADEAAGLVPYSGETNNFEIAGNQAACP